MNNETKQPNPEAEKQKEINALMMEFRSLLRLAREDYKHRMRMIVGWFMAEMDKAVQASKEGGSPNTGVLKRQYKEQMDALYSEHVQLLEKIKSDTLEKLTDVRFRGRAEELMKEITAEEWGKWFGESHHS